MAAFYNLPTPTTGDTKGDSRFEEQHLVCAALLSELFLSLCGQLPQCLFTGYDVVPLPGKDALSGSERRLNPLKSG